MVAWASPSPLPKAEYPAYFYITLQYVTSKFPRWNDDPNALRKALKSLNDDPELKARVMWHLHDYAEGESIPTGGKAAKDIRKGFRAIEAKYKSPITTNQLALFACIYWNNQSLFDEVNTRITSPDFNIWRKPDNYTGCVDGNFGCTPAVYLGTGSK